MSIDIIITTYNRPIKVLELVHQLLTLTANHDNMIIVVDSSESDNEELKKNTFKVKYLHSSHKNQPYQRFVGYMSSASEYLIFLDDDMEVIDNDFISKVFDILIKPEISGIAIKFENKHEDSLLAKIPTTKLTVSNKRLNQIKGWITGWPVLKTGQFGLCGNRGKQPVGGGITEWLSGGAFAAKRAAMFQNFNFQLFDIFEKKMGMGEDAIIGYGLSKRGTLIYHDELFFLHNDQNDSSYTIDKYAYARRVMFSRLYLSLEKQRINKRNLPAAYFHFHYYAFWRITGYLINFVASPNKNRRDMLMGTLAGWREALKFNFRNSAETNNYWVNEAKNDIEKI